jgi:hypothetical protein
MSSPGRDLDLTGPFVRLNLLSGASVHSAEMVDRRHARVEGYRADVVAEAALLGGEPADVYSEPSQIVRYK